MYKNDCKDKKNILIYFLKMYKTCKKAVNMLRRIIKYPLRMN